VSLADALERAASKLPAAADAIRPANGDPERVLAALAPDAAAQVLAWLLANEPDSAGELADAWAERDEAAPVFAAVDDAALPKAGRKLLRRALHRLRSRGVAVGEKAPEPRVARVAAADEEIEAAFVSPIDPGGARIVTLIESNPAGGARLFEVITDARAGVVECRIYTTTRGRARRFAQELATRERFGGTPVPRDAARALLARAAARQPGDRPLPRAFAEWRTHLAGAPEGAATPGELARAALGVGADERGAARRAAELVRERKIGPWLPADAGLRALAEKLQEAARSRIIVTGSRRREQLEEVLREGEAEVFAGDEAARAAEWLEETAFLLWKAAREDDARACLAAAREAAGAGEGEIRRALLETALAPLLERLRAEEREQDATSLVVKP
jgi:hypothetical protein